MSPMAKRKSPRRLKQSRVVMAVLRPCPSPLPPPRHRLKSSTSKTLRGVKYKDNCDGGLAARIPRVRVVKRSNLHTFEAVDQARLSKNSVRSRENRLANKLVTLVLDESGQSRTAVASAGCQTIGAACGDSDDNGPVLRRPAVAPGSPNAVCCTKVADAPLTVKYQRVTECRPLQCGELNVQPGVAGDFSSDVTQCWSSAKVGCDGSTEHCPCCLNSQRDHSTGAVNHPPVLCSGDHLRARSDCFSNNYRSCSGRDDVGTAKLGDLRRTGALRSTGRFHGNDPSVVRENMVSKSRKCLRSRTSSQAIQSKSPRFRSTRSGLVSVSPGWNTLGSDRQDTCFVRTAQSAKFDCTRLNDRGKLSRPGPTSPGLMNKKPSPIKEPSVTMNSHSHGSDTPRVASVDVSLSPPSPVMRRLAAIGYEPRSIYLQRLINKYSARVFKDRLPTSRTQSFAGERPQSSPKLVRHVLKSQSKGHLVDTAGGHPLPEQSVAWRGAAGCSESPVRYRQRVDERPRSDATRSPESPVRRRQRVDDDPRSDATGSPESPVRRRQRVDDDPRSDARGSLESPVRRHRRIDDDARSDARGSPESPMRYRQRVDDEARSKARGSPESPVRRRQHVDEDDDLAVHQSPEYHSGTVRFSTDPSAARHVISSRTSACGSLRNKLPSKDPKANLGKASPAGSIRSAKGKKRFSPISEAITEVDRDASDESSPHNHFHSGAYQQSAGDRHQHFSADLGRQCSSRKSCLKRTRQKRAHSSDPDRARSQPGSQRQDWSEVAVDAATVNNPSADSLHRSYNKCVHQYYLSPRLFMEPMFDNDEDSVTSACRICRATRSIQQLVPQEHRRDVGERVPPQAGSPAGQQHPEVDGHTVDRRRPSEDCSSELVRLTVPQALFSDCPTRQPTRLLSAAAGTTGYTSRHQTASASAGRRVSYRRPQPASFSLRRRIGEIS